MFDQPLDLATARILLSNDDGINAPGLKVLEKIAKSLCPDVWVVAPEQEQSGASHSLTLRNPLRIRQVSRRRFAVDGTPTDCVLLAVRQILKDKRPTLVLSGVNAGGNFGEDVTYSGTVAAAMEATLFEIPAIAFSQYYDRGSGLRWHVAEAYAAPVIRRLTAAPWPRNTLINVNFPDVAVDAVTGIEATRQGKRKLGDNLTERLDPRGVPYYWIGPVSRDLAGEPGTDVAGITAGAVTVTPINLDLTSMPALAELRKLFP